MKRFRYRVRGKGEAAMLPRAPTGPWLELEADSFDDRYDVSRYTRER